ncbi:BC1872 family protein [Sinorhizobium meliloti]|uniref:BC1872 family protein n=1 Tax=Rhizobium meliloti TaxID=382 RepID=UPI003D66263E
MAVSDLIVELETAGEPDRGTDAKIALLFGWQRRVEAAGGATKSRKVFWLHPKTGENRLPAFTYSVDAALELVDLVSPKSYGGVSWATDSKGVTCTVKVSEGAYSHAATPALAICVAALKLKKSEGNLEDEANVDQ